MLPQASVQGSILQSKSADDSVSITTHGNEKIGIDVEGNATKGFLIREVQANSVADTSGKIETGDILTGITIDLNTLKLNEAQSLLKVLSPYPVKITVRKSENGGDLSADSHMIDSGIEIKGPSFEMHGRKAKGGAGIDVSLPEKDINMGSLKKKKVADIDVQSPTGNLSIAKELNFENNAKHGRYLIKFPKVNESKTLGGKADLNGKITSPIKFENVNDKEKKLPSGEIRVKGNMSGSRGDIDLPEGDFNVDASLPDVDLKAPKGSGGFDVNLPSFGIKGKGPKGEVELPDAHLDASLPDADLDLKGSKGKGGFHFNMPKFGFKGKGPKGEIDMPEGDFNVDGSLPDADVNVKAPKGSGGFNMNLPSFGFGGKGPKGDIDLPEGDVNVDANLPDVNAKGGKGGFHIGMPSLPKVSLKGKGVKGDADFDVNLPEGDINVNAEAPDVNIKGPKGSGGFNIGMPKFGMKGKGPKGDIDLPEGDFNVDASLPDVDLKTPKGSGGFNVNLPSFGIKGKGPKGEVDLPDAHLDASLPDADLDLKASKGDI